MHLKRTVIVFFVLLLLARSYPAYGASGDIGLVSSSLKFQPSTGLEGRTARIYVTAHNFSKDDLKGVIRFFNGKPPQASQIQGDQAVSAVSGGDDTVFIDALLPPGTHEIHIQFIPFEPAGDSTDNNIVTKSFTVLKDTDRDGIPDSKDDDDDNDGVPDSKDAFPFNSKEWRDTDGDGKGDNTDDDDDNDGVLDVDDDLPLNADEFKDTDGDGIGDKSDPDDDGDGISDEEEIKLGLNPLNKDTDGDGVSDGEDVFPFDPKEWKDYDGDGIGDNGDEDADGDGVLKQDDINDTNFPPKIIVSSLPFFILPGREFSFNTSRSNDPDGEIIEMKLRIDGQGTLSERKIGNNESATVLFEKPGKYSLSVIATDNNMETSIKKFNISVNTPMYYTLVSSALLGALILAILITLQYSSLRRLKSRKKNHTSRKSRNKKNA